MIANFIVLYSLRSVKQSAAFPVISAEFLQYYRCSARPHWGKQGPRTLPPVKNIDKIHRKPYDEIWFMIDCVRRNAAHGLCRSAAFQTV